MELSESSLSRLKGGDQSKGKTLLGRFRVLVLTVCIIQEGGEEEGLH